MPAETFLVWESDCEIEGWVPLLRDFHHLGANIDAFPITWSDGSQKVAGVTANREHPFLRFHQESKKTGQQFVVVFVACYPALASRSNFSQMVSGPLAPLLEGSQPPDELRTGFRVSQCRPEKLRALSRRRMCAKFQPDPSAFFTE